MNAQSLRTPLAPNMSPHVNSLLKEERTSEKLLNESKLEMLIVGLWSKMKDGAALRAVVQFTG